MEHFEALYREIVRRGWYTGKLTLNVETVGAFEGFSGRASETWEYQTTIAVAYSHDQVNYPPIKVVGNTHQTPDDVAKQVLAEIKLKWHA